jgi:hypothetical protein
MTIDGLAGIVVMGASMEKQRREILRLKAAIRALEALETKLIDGSPSFP